MHAPPTLLLLLALPLASAEGFRGGGGLRWPPSAGTAQAKDALDELQRIDSEWEFVLKNNGVSVWKRGHRSGESAPFAVRATIFIPCPPRAVAAVLLTRDYELIRRFNPTISGGEDLEWRDGRRERTTYVLTKPIWPLRPRDFVCNVRHEIVGGGAELIVNSPATHARAPRPPRTVRGTLRGLHLCEPHRGGSGCVYTCIHEIDPGGAAPRRLVNWFALRKPLQYMVQLRDVCEERHKSATQRSGPSGSDGAEVDRGQ